MHVVICHVRPEGHGQAAGLDQRLAGRETQVIVVEDIYLATARIFGREGPPIDIAVVCVDDLFPGEFEFFSLLRRERPDLRTYAYGRPHSAEQVETAIARGADGELTSALIDTILSPELSALSPEFAALSPEFSGHPGSPVSAEDEAGDSPGAADSQADSRADSQGDSQADSQAVSFGHDATSQSGGIQDAAGEATSAGAGSPFGVVGPPETIVTDAPGAEQPTPVGRADRTDDEAGRAVGGEDAAEAEHEEDVESDVEADVEDGEEDGEPMRPVRVPWLRGGEVPVRRAPHQRGDGVSNASDAPPPLRRRSEDAQSGDARGQGESRGSGESRGRGGAEEPLLSEEELRALFDDDDAEDDA